MRELRKLLYRFGIYKTQEGYEPLLVAVELILENFELLGCLTKWLYPVVAAICGGTPGAVERNIRYCVARAWEANPALFTEIALRPITPAPLPPAISCACYITTWMTSCSSNSNRISSIAASQAYASGEPALFSGVYGLV